MRMQYSVYIHKQWQQTLDLISHLSSLTLTVVGAPQMVLQQYLSPVFRCPHGISKLHSCPFLDVIFSSLLLSSSPSCSFHCPLQNCLTVLCRIVFNMPEDFGMWPYHLSFRFFTMVRRSSYTPVAFCCEPPRSSHSLCRKFSDVFYSISSQGLGSFS